MAGSSKKRVAKKTLSYFKPSWEEEYFIIRYGDVVKCLVCGKVLNQFKKFSLPRHYNAYHSKDYMRLTREERLSEVEQLKANVAEEAQEGDNEPAVRASFSISLELARTLRSFNDGKFVKDCILRVIENLCPQEIEKFRAINLSRATIARRFQDAARNVLDQLATIAEEFVAFSLSLDTSIDLSGVPYMSIFIRGVNNGLHITEELLDFVPVGENPSGEDIFTCVEEVMESNNLDWNKLVSVATDGAPAMIKRNNGFADRLKRKLNALGVSNQVPVIHSLIHNEYLCGRSAEVSSVMALIANITNYIRQHGRRYLQFRPFAYELDVEYGKLSYHSEVRWLHRGKLLDKFFHIREDVAMFMETMGRPVPELKDTQWLMDLAFVSDLVDHLNMLNVSLQRMENVITDLRDTIQAFITEIQLWIEELGAENSCHFPKLKSLTTAEINFTKYVNILEILSDELKNRFVAMTNLEINFNIFARPFSTDMESVEAIQSVPPQMQMEFIDMQWDWMLKGKFNRKSCLFEFYKNFPREKFPQFHEHAAKMLSMFGSVYVFEQFFLHAMKTKSAYRTQITNYHLKCLLIATTSKTIAPNVRHLLEQKKLQRSMGATGTQ